MRSLMMAALSATAICGFAVAATPTLAQETVTGAPKGTAPATTEGYGPSSVIVCNEGGYCWHSTERYDYPSTADIVVHPYDWRWNEGDRFAWREHTGRGYWRGDDWEAF